MCFCPPLPPSSGLLFSFRFERASKANREEPDGGKKENSVGGFVGICIKKTLQTRFLSSPGEKTFDENNVVKWMLRRSIVFLSPNIFGFNNTRKMILISLENLFSCLILLLVRNKSRKVLRFLLNMHSYNLDFTIGREICGASKFLENWILNAEGLRYD